MANARITIVGTLTADPELRFVPSGSAVANFTVAHNPRKFDKASGEWTEQEALFLNCSVWRQYAEQVAESLEKGMRVIVEGELKARSYEAKDGTKKTVWELEVDEVGPSLRYATAKVTRVQRSGGGGGRQRPQQAAGDPWGAPQPRGAQSDPWAQSRPAEPPW